MTSVVVVVVRRRPIFPFFSLYCFCRFATAPAAMAVDVPPPPHGSETIKEMSQN
jgi:hypothetical protein